ncbi:putative Glutamyl-tRNA amidotransferase subunit (Amidase) [Seiridium cardinale]
MSIISLSNDVELSSISVEGLHRLAQELNISIPDIEDANSYLLLLRSFESVMLHVRDSTDYVPPALTPQATIGSRKYWKPDPNNNPMNAWSHQCHIRSADPSNKILEGRTIAVKDIVSIGGLPTTLGTHPEILSNNGTIPISQIDATVVSRILSAGAVIKGSSTCENFCASPLSFTSVTGPVHHPLLHGFTSGGSSSGSCVLVAANAMGNTGTDSFGDTVELAIGSDQAGSVRIPASYNGIYGLKPTFGLIPYTGTASMSPMIDHLGPIASNIEDIASLLKVMAGYDGFDARMTPESPLVPNVKDYPKIVADFREQACGQTKDSESRFRVGLLTESFAMVGLSPEVRDLVQQAAREGFESAGVEVMDISIPMHSEGPTIWTASTRPSMSQWLCQGKPSGHLSYLPPHINTQWPPDQDMYELLTSSNPAVVNIMLSEMVSNHLLDSSLEAKAHRKVFELRAAYDNALEVVDVLVTPCAPTISTAHPRLQNIDGNRSSILEKLKPAIGLTSNTCPFNVTGHPAMNTPCGSLASPEHPDINFPVGMQIIGKIWNDESVLKAAILFEEGQKRTHR